MAELPEGFSNWDEYDAFRKATGPSLRKSYPNAFTEFIATNPVTGLLVPGAERFLQVGQKPSLWDFLGLGAELATPFPLLAGIKKFGRAVRSDKKSDDLYHVTYSKHADSIEGKGLTRGQEGNWWYQSVDPPSEEIYAFTNPRDAVLFAQTMRRRSPAGEGYTIVRVKRGDKKKWEKDPNWERNPPSADSYNPEWEIEGDYGVNIEDWSGDEVLRTKGDIAQEDIVRMFDIHQFPQPGSKTWMQGQYGPEKHFTGTGQAFTKWVDMVSGMISMPAESYVKQTLTKLK